MVSFSYIIRIMEEKRKPSKKQNASVNKYKRLHYDRIGILVPKGKKEIIQSAADNAGESMNTFINRAIDSRLNDNQD